MSGDALHVINDYPNQSSVTINAADHSVLTLETEGLGVVVNGGPPVPVGLNIHGRVFLHVPSANGADLTVSGGRLTFIGGSSQFTGTNQVFDVPLRGHSNIILTSATHIIEHMEVGGYVGRGLNFEIDGNGPPLTSLQIDHPDEFHGTLTVNAAGPLGHGLDYVAFMGIQATNIDIKGDVLQMFDGCKLVDSTTCRGATSGIEFQQTNTGVMLDRCQFWRHGICHPTPRHHVM